jgi:tetratricopeptide (TPR) repeat protein
VVQPPPTTRLTRRTATDQPHLTSCGVLHLAEHAGTLLAGSGSRAFQQLDHPSASNLLGRARALLAPRHPLLTEFLPDLGISLVEISQLAAAEDVLDQALLLAAEENDLGAYWRARAERERLAIYLNPARPGLVELGDELDAALDNLAAVGDQLALARCWSLRVDIECCTGGRIGCGESGAKALAHAVAAGSRPDEERAIGYYVWQLVVGRTPLQEGIRICERLYAERQHDVMGEALCLLDLGLLVAATGRFDQAREYANRSMRACNDVGFAYWGTHALHVAGQIELWAKRPAQAEPYLRAALDRFAAAQDEWFQQLVAADIADALILLGRADEAESLLHGHERPSGDPDDVGHLSTIRSRALLALDRPEEAAAAARHAVSVLEKSDYPARLAYARLALARSLDVLDRGREARAAAEEARRLFLRKGHRIGQQATDDLLECMAVPAARRGPAASSPTSP